MSKKAIGRATMMLDAERACACSARASRSTSCAAVTEDSRSANSGTSSPPPGRWMSTAAASMSNSGSPMRSRASFHACLRPIDLAAMRRNSARSGTGPRSASTAIAWFTLVAPVSRSCLSILVASRTASCRTTRWARDRAVAAARTADMAPAPAGTASTVSPVIAIAHEAAAIAVEHSRATRVLPSNQDQPVSAARLSSCDQPLAAARVRRPLTPRCAGEPTARIATITPSPATRAAAVSIIEAVPQSRRLGDLSKLGPDPLWHRRGGADPMPTAVRTQRDELLQQRPAVVETRHAAEREKLALPGLRSAASDDRGVQNEVDGVHDLGEHRIGARGLRVAKSEPDQSRQSFARTVRVQGEDRAWVPCISLRCTDTCREKFKSGLADQKLIAVTPTSRRSSRVRPQILGRDGSRSALGQRDLNLGMSRWAQLI